MSDTDRRIADLITDLAPMRDAADLPDLFAALARSVVRTLSADACLVSLCDDEAGELRDVAASVVPPAKMNTVVETYKLEEYPVTEAVIKAQTHAELSIHDPAVDKRERTVMEEMGFARVLMCGFSIEDEVAGTVEAYRLQDRPFRTDDPEQIDLLIAFAGNHYSRIQLASRLEAHYTETMEALTSALEARDPYTEAHVGRIRDLAIALGLALKVSPDVRKSIHLGALLHDVGKIGISDAILQKDGPLSDEEWTIMRRHPEIGERMLRRVDFLRPALSVIRHHHERWDGKGYPDGLQGEDIPLAARIVAVCDAFDAMTSDRPYRRATTAELACDEIASHAGSQFDPRCAQLLIRVVREIGQEDLEEKFVRFAS
ncbi:MAG TPA: HD-GYP domain-containing protein [Actinomycetota bacterium]|nr:HD-GYP domain-containing protein [Actinomycetota bacterium]